jgi:hypothetical protein
MRDDSMRGPHVNRKINHSSPNPLLSSRSPFLSRCRPRPMLGTAAPSTCWLWRLLLFSSCSWLWHSSLLARLRLHLPCPFPPPWNLILPPPASSSPNPTELHAPDVSVGAPTRRGPSTPAPRAPTPRSRGRGVQRWGHGRHDNRGRERGFRPGTGSASRTATPTLVDGDGDDDDFLSSAGAATVGKRRR